MYWEATMTPTNLHFYGDETPLEFIKILEQKGFHFTDEQKETAKQQERERMRKEREQK